jgi:hypothetical protein
VSQKLLPFYLAELDFWYSTRDTQRTKMLVGKVSGKRLTYGPLKETL